MEDILNKFNDGETLTDFELLRLHVHILQARNALEPLGAQFYSAWLEADRILLQIIKERLDS